MPHALVGYTDGDVLAAMKLFAQTIPEAKTLIALVDYTGEEITDSLRDLFVASECRLMSAVSPVPARSRDSAGAPGARAWPRQVA